MFVGIKSMHTRPSPTTKSSLAHRTSSEKKKNKKRFSYHGFLFVLVYISEGQKSLVKKLYLLSTPISGDPTEYKGTQDIIW